MRFALALAASASAARWPFTSEPLDFWAGGGKLFVSSGAASARLHIKGVSWFGFETSTACVHELWAHSLDAYLNFLVTHEFNAIRLPLAIDNVLNNPGLSHWECRTGGRSLDFLETVVVRCVVCSSGGQRRVRSVRVSARRVPQRRRDTAVPAAVQGLVQSAVEFGGVSDLWFRGLRGL